jgi:hypothetical protein
LSAPSTLEEFRASLAGPAPPAGLRDVLRALWHAGRDEWDAAHEIAQKVDNAEGAEEEWERIVRALLG